MAICKAAGWLRAVLTILVELENGVLGVQVPQQLLGGVAVRAVRLGEDNDGIVVNQLLCTGGGGGHGGGRGGGKGCLLYTSDAADEMD